MSDFEMIGQILNAAMQSGQVQNCGSSDGGDIVIISPSGEGFRFFFTFDKATGSAVNITFENMKNALSEAGISV